MPHIIIYTTPICPYCVQAKKLFAKKGVSYQEVDVSQDAQLREEMMHKSGGRRSVPQIFINDQHIGGCDDLYALEQKGALDPLLRS
jgi:glutaredoxin 3